MMTEAKQQCVSSFFMELFMLGAWLIWKQRNDAIFNRGRLAFQSWKRGFIEEASIQANRMKDDKFPLFNSVLNLYR
jgi:hypothetical protein